MLAVSCGSPNPVGSNLVTPTVCTDTVFQSTCVVSCASGYTGANGVSRQCQANGDWSQSGNVGCFPTTCNSGTVVGPALATLNRAFVSCATRPTNGDACVAKCQDGFQGTSTQYFCELPTSSSTSVALVHRNGSATACTPITCSLASLQTALGLTILSSSTASGTGTGWDNPTTPSTFSYGGHLATATCPIGNQNCFFTPTCASGFVAVGPFIESIDPFRCIAQDQWSSGRRVCRPRSCGSPLSGIANSVATSCPTTFGSQCAVQCAPG